MISNKTIILQTFLRVRVRAGHRHEEQEGPVAAFPVGEVGFKQRWRSREQ